MLLTAGVQKFPCFEFGSARLEGFEYLWVWEVCELVPEWKYHNHKKMREVLERVESSWEDNPKIQYDRK